MNDADCKAFLQWALPRLGLRWSGFRRVRGQVCKRIDRRIHGLALSGTEAYKTYLCEQPTEWTALDGLCCISVSRFYRDRLVFDSLADHVLPALAERAEARRSRVIHCWSAGCASGEEPYTLRLLWEERLRPRYRLTSLAIVATDLDEQLLGRARAACYGPSSLRELPPEWVDRAFDRKGDRYCLRDRWKAGIEFRRQDLRIEQPAGRFDLILCRNVAFTYFTEAVQRDVLARIAERLAPGGCLVIGRHESLAKGAPFLSWTAAPGVYRKAP